MGIQDMFNGVAVIIDDEADDNTANISAIIKQIESADIPLLKYTSLPNEKIIRHFQNLSFLLLDWNLKKEKIEDGVAIPDTLQNDEVTENIGFIKKLNEHCFCPIFIFTNENPDEIKQLLIKEGVMTDNQPSNLFIESKNDLEENDAVFSKVEDWLNKTPSVYVLKEWEREYQKCKTRLFSDFHAVNPHWPSIMWANFEADGANKSLEIGELITRNLHSRMTPFEFKDDILNTDTNSVPKAELRKVLEGERFLKKGCLHKGDIGTGDLFREEYLENEKTKNRYFLNIRAQCDLLRNDNIDQVYLYCLKGRVFDENKINEEGGISIINGHFIEKINHSIIPFLDDGKIIEFLFREINLIKWKDLKEKRIGRLLPPYITKIQQRYALYMQRQGVPQIPDAAIFPLKEDGDEK